MFFVMLVSIENPPDLKLSMVKSLAFMGSLFMAIGNLVEYAKLDTQIKLLKLLAKLQLEGIHEMQHNNTRERTP